MSKKLKWSELKELRDLVATQNVALLTAVLETVKTNKKHFDTVTEDRNYVFLARITICDYNDINNNKYI